MSDIHSTALDKRHTLFVLGGVGLYSHTYAALWHVHQEQQRKQKGKIKKHISLPELLAHVREVEKRSKKFL